MNRWVGFVVGVVIALTAVMTLVRPVDVVPDASVPSFAVDEVTRTAATAQALPQVSAPSAGGSAVAIAPAAEGASAGSGFGADGDMMASGAAVDKGPLNQPADVTRRAPDPSANAARSAGDDTLRAGRQSLAGAVSVPARTETHWSSNDPDRTADAVPSVTQSALSDAGAARVATQADAAVNVDDAVAVGAQLPLAPRELPSVTPEADATAPALAPAPGSSALQTGLTTSAQNADDLRQWYAFWQPFSSELSARGFRTRLERLTGLDYRVVKVDSGQYHVAFGYDDERSRVRHLLAIEEATGLSLGSESF